MLARWQTSFWAPKLSFLNAFRNKTLTTTQTTAVYMLRGSNIHVLRIHTRRRIPQQPFTLKDSRSLLTQRSVRVRMHISQGPKGQRPRTSQFVTPVQRIVFFLGTLFVVIGVVIRNKSPNLLNPFQATVATQMDTNKIPKGVNDFGNSLFSNLGENVSNQLK